MLEENPRRAFRVPQQSHARTDAARRSAACTIVLDLCRPQGEHIRANRALGYPMPDFGKPSFDPSFLAPVISKLIFQNDGFMLRPATRSGGPVSPIGRQIAPACRMSRLQAITGQPAEPWLTNAGSLACVKGSATAQSSLVQPLLPVQISSFVLPEYWGMSSLTHCASGRT